MKAKTILEALRAEEDQSKSYMISNLEKLSCNKNEAWNVTDYLSEKYKYCSYFVDTLEDLIAILSSNKILAKKNKAGKIDKGICFTGGEDLYRIAKRYKNKPNYKYGIIFYVDLLKYLKRKSPNNVVFVNEFVDKLSDASGYKITGVYKLNKPGLFILRPYIYNFSTPVLINNQQLYDRIKKRLDEMIELYPKAYGSLITKDISNDVKILAEDNDCTITEAYTFAATTCKLAFTCDKWKDNWDYEEVKNILQKKPSDKILKLKADLFDTRQKSLRSYGDDRRYLEDKVDALHSEIDHLYKADYGKWGIENEKDYTEFCRKHDFNNNPSERVPMQFIYVNKDATSRNDSQADIDSLAYSDLDEHEIRVTNTSQIYFEPSVDIAEIVVQNEKEKNNPELRLLLGDNVPIHTLSEIEDKEKRKKEGN